MKSDKAIQKIALKNGISTTEVRREIQHALDEGLKNINPAVRDYWKRIPCRGEKPTVDEVIAFVAKEVEHKKTR